MTIVGVVLLVLGVGLIIAHVMSRKKVGALRVARDMTRSEIDGTAKMLAGELGGGSFSEFISIRGRAECDAPLISPLGEVECLYYEMRVVREYEETYQERDNEGRTRTRTRRGSETMSSESNGVYFAIGDATGSTPVDPNGADFEGLRQSVDSFEPGGGHSTSLSFGRFSFSVGRLGSGRRTIGYRYQESVLPVDGDLTVVGQASDASGELRIGRGGLKFIISPRTKAEIIGSAMKTAQWTSIASGVAILAGAVTLIIGLVSK